MESVQLFLIPLRYVQPLGFDKMTSLISHLDVRDRYKLTIYAI